MRATTIPPVIKTFDVELTMSLEEAKELLEYVNHHAQRPGAKVFGEENTIDWMLYRTLTDLLES